MTKANNSEQALALFDTDFELEHYIPFKLVQAELNMRKAIAPESIDAAKKVAKLSKNEFRVIAYIALKGPIAPSQIALQVGLGRAVVTRSIASLTHKKLVAASPNEADQRSKFIHLSDKGVRLCEQFIPKMQRFGEYLDEALTVQEKDTLMQLLGKLLIASKNYNPEGK